MNINHLFEKLAADAPILQATFGLEREGLRINQDGKLAQTPHPQAYKEAQNDRNAGLEAKLDFWGHPRTKARNNSPNAKCLDRQLHYNKDLCDATTETRSTVPFACRNLRRAYYPNRY